MLRQIKDALQKATIHGNSQAGIIFHEMDAIDSPPTFFRTNKFTNAFQEIVDAYGFVLFYLLFSKIFIFAPEKLKISHDPYPSPDLLSGEVFPMF